MPSIVGIIDLLSGPQLALLQQVVDLHGPYGPGDYTLVDFRTDGAFGIPAGTYDLGAGVAGVIVEVTRIPVEAGVTFGWNDATFPIASGDYYLDRMVQVCLLHTLPTTGATIVTDIVDVHNVQQLVLWPFLLGSQLKLGLHVNPGYECDLYFMCVG